HSADDGKHGDLVLPIRRRAEQVTREHTVSQHERRDEKRDHAEDRHHLVDAADRALERAQRSNVDRRLRYDRAFEVDVRVHWTPTLAAEVANAAAALPPAGE